MKKNSFQKFKTGFLSVVSGVALVFFAWMFIYGKGKTTDYLKPLIAKLPINQQALTNFTDKVLGLVVEKAKEQDTKTMIQKGTEVFETSEFAQPARDVREDVKKKIDQVVETIKEIPAKELKIIKYQIYKRWFEEVATESGRN